MTDQSARVAWWRVVALRLRALTGWGLEAPDLSRWARYYALQATYSLVMMVLFPAAFIAIGNLLPRIGIGGSQPKPVSLILRASVPLLVTCLLLTLTSIGMSVLHRRRANAGASQPSVTFDGYCFTVVGVPMSFLLFALIGVSHQHAQWFRLPIGWDTAIEPGDERIELTYNPVTGFVERITRTGADARVLFRPPEDHVDPGEANVADDGEATPAQRREMMRLLRRAGAHWGVSTGSMLALGLATLFCGAYCEIAPVVLFGMARAYPKQPDSASSQPLVIAGLILAAIGIASFTYGIHIMRVWAQFRRSDVLEPVILSGDQLYWTPKGSRRGTVGDYLALVRADDGSRVVLRIPRKWRHRLWRHTGRVRVIYNTVSGRVRDYRPMEPSALP